MLAYWAANFLHFYIFNQSSQSNMKNYQKKLVQVFFVLCLFIDINTFVVVQALQSKKTGSYLKEFDNFISADYSNNDHKS